MTKNQSNAIHITRVYDAPVALVWDAWTNLEHVSKWWGPRGFTLTTHSKDLRAGGIWHYTMHGPDGTDYPNKTKYHEVVPEARLVYDHGGYDDRKPLFHVTVDFKEVSGKTCMDMVATLETAEAAQKMREFIKSAGGNATWDRLAEYLASTSSDRQIFVINRSFAAPVDLVFEMWSNPKHMCKWSPPTGSEMEFIKADIRAGGDTFYKMTNKDFTLYGRAHYLEIKRPHRMVYTQQFCDKDQNISRHPLAPTWPETMLTTVEFNAESDDTTRVTVTWEVHGKCSAEELETFIKARGGMTQGWTGSFDKLEKYLENQ